MNLTKFSRQFDLIDPSLLEKSITIIGAGGIGSWSTLTLAKMGCSLIGVQDFDKVELENTASQLYGEKHIGMYKVDALQEIVEELTSIKIVPNYDHWEKNTPVISPIVVSGLDSLDVRGDLWESIKNNPMVEWYIDGRMSGNIIRIYTVKIGEDNAWYEKTLVGDKNLEPEKCTEKAVAYNTLMIGSVIANLVKKVCKGESYKREVIVDLVNLEIL
jgi:hypothetical protein